MLAELAHALRNVDPDRPAVIGSLSRAALADLADGYALALHHSGLSTGDTLGFAVRPGPRALAVMRAAHRLGLRVEHGHPQPQPVRGQHHRERPRTGPHRDAESVPCGQSTVVQRHGVPVGEVGQLAAGELADHGRPVGIAGA